MRNDYVIRGDVTSIRLTSHKYGPVDTLIDTADLPLVKSFPNKWYPAWTNDVHSFYVKGHIKNNGKETTVRLHRWLFTDIPSFAVVDHINNDTLDNRRSNLRICTDAENQQNRSGAWRKSFTGIRGVCWSKYHRKWHAQIKLNWKRIHIGYFDDIREAEKAVKEARAGLMPFSKDARDACTPEILDREEAE